MNFTISARIWSSDLTPSEKMVLLALDHLGDNDGFSWYGYDKIAEMTGISKESKYLTRILNALEKKGYLLIWRQHGHGGGRGYTHIYWPIIGRTDQEIMEIIMRRFSATREEAETIIRQDGPLYQQLVKGDRISGKKLEQTRQRKGVPEYTYNEEKGVLESPNSEERVYQNPPKNEKGVPESPRSKESLIIESNPRKESYRERESRARKEKPCPQNLKPIPSVEIHKEIFHIELNQVQVEEIINEVGDTPASLEKWRLTLRAWAKAGYEGKNVTGQLEWLSNGIPVYKNGAYKNGSNQQRSESIRGTGQELDEKFTIDINTDEYVYPDGHRERIPAVS